MRNKIMMVVFFLCAQSFFSQITITNGATLYVDGKSIVSASKDADKEISSETVLIGKIKVVSAPRLDSDGSVSPKKAKKSAVKALAKVSPKKKTVANTIRTKKIERFVFIPYPNKSSFSSSRSDHINSVLPSAQTELKLACPEVRFKNNISVSSGRTQSAFLNEILLFYNHFHSSLSVRPPPFA